MTKHAPRPCVLIPADDDKPVQVIAEQSCDLASLQKLVGGYIELARIHRQTVLKVERMHLCVLGKNAQMYVNEDGRNLDLPYNERASHLYGHPMGIVGDAFIMAVP